MRDRELSNPVRQVSLEGDARTSGEIVGKEKGNKVKVWIVNGVRLPEQVEARIDDGGYAVYKPIGHIFEKWVRPTRWFENKGAARAQYIANLESAIKSRERVLDRLRKRLSEEIGDDERA